MWKIAIVDDDFQVLRGLRHIIPWAELDAEFAGEAIDGEEGLELVRRVGPDIVITDLYMPGISGIEMIEKLRGEGFAGRFVIHSGYTDFEYARQAIRLDVDDYLNKPITVNQIREVLFRTIGRLEDSYLENMEKKKLISFVQNYEKQTASEQLAGLLNGTVQANAAELKLPGPRLHWEDRDQLTAVVELVKTDRITDISVADWHLFRFAMSNVAKELTLTEWPEAEFVWLFGAYSAFVLHISREESPERLSKRLAYFTELITDSMQRYLGLTVRIGLGQRKQLWSELKASADEAFEALNTSSQSQGAIDLVRRLSNALQRNSEESLWSHVQAYIDQQEIAAIGGEVKLFYKVLATELWTLLQYAAGQADLAIMEEEDNGAAAAVDIVMNRHDLESYLNAKLKMIGIKRQPVISQKHKAAVDFMIGYIHEHYASDLTMDELAGKLFISKNYLNQLFKKVTGETFMNYVIRVRLEKAKALLLEGNYLIYEVAEQVGYQNVPYFSTLFKKYCGMNPSDLLKK
ncbi:response regulator transcription factor [Paenibacillus whitsoniae]|uniref:Response regulator n=1 Tax=Paenibacillus whitsoniae TaxID=2496558 RepID=A0A3S0AB94_9BACL|nr:helix-turn-helix domain-containing protein [Paenibacillus whitsoniae]RTE08923.1 response regulator [Paenibacillus whitsoniae]